MESVDPYNLGQRSQIYLGTKAKAKSPQKSALRDGHHTDPAVVVLVFSWSFLVYEEFPNSNSLEICRPSEKNRVSEVASKSDDGSVIKPKEMMFVHFLIPDRSSGIDRVSKGR